MNSKESEKFKFLESKTKMPKEKNRDKCIIVWRVWLKWRFTGTRPLATLKYRLFIVVIYFIVIAIDTWEYHSCHKSWIPESNNNKPSRGVSRLPTVFLTKKLSKYRLKRPKYIVLGTPKKPDKIPKNGQNRFLVINNVF